MKKKKHIKTQTKTLYEAWMETLEPMEWFSYISQGVIPQGTDMDYYNKIKQEYLDKVIKPMLEKEQMS